MSTVSAQIIVAASSVAHDIVEKIYGGGLTNRQMLLISRVTIGVLGVGAMLIALAKTQVIFWFVLFAWSGLGASFGPLILFTLYSKNVTREGAIAGMLTGFSVTILWKVSGLSAGLYELVPAFAMASLAIFLVSGRKTVEDD
jgi:Na+/proline symporter